MLWLVLLACSLISRSHIDAGIFGLIGFPVIAAIYAWIRRSKDSELASQIASSPIPAPPKMDEFLRDHPEFNTSHKSVRDRAFYQWLNREELRG